MKEILASTTLKDTVDAGSNLLLTKGSKLQFTLGKEIKTDIPSFTADEFSQLSTDLGLSDTGTLQLAKNIRTKFKGKSIEPNLKSTLDENKGEFADFFEVSNETFMQMHQKNNYICL